MNEGELVESTINQVVSQRMVKKQQMQWTGHPAGQGAHLLLQVRTQVIDEDWEATFRNWYPGSRPSHHW
jgi:DNA gyrase inhibitor GyrI